MRLAVAIQIFKILNDNTVVTAESLAKDCQISMRSVHRYLDELTCCGIPINTKRGRYGGGISLEPEFKKRNYNLLVMGTEYQRKRRRGKYC